MNGTDRKDLCRMHCGLKRDHQSTGLGHSVRLFHILSQSLLRSRRRRLHFWVCGWPISDKSPTNKCDDVETITVSAKRVHWSHESTCGKIENVQRGKSADNVIVNMTCVDEGEGIMWCRRRPSRTFRMAAQIWLFSSKLEGKPFMTQTSGWQIEALGSFKKCD